MLEATLSAGVDVVRLNLSHGSAEDHRQRLARVREIAAPGDLVILTRGDHMNAHGGTNTLRILEVETQHE